MPASSRSTDPGGPAWTPRRSPTRTRSPTRCSSWRSRAPGRRHTSSRSRRWLRGGSLELSPDRDRVALGRAPRAVEAEQDVGVDEAVAGGRAERAAEAEPRVALAGLRVVHEAVTGTAGPDVERRRHERGVVALGDEVPRSRHLRVDDEPA